MAFISMVFASMFFLILGTGLVSGLVGLILSVTWGSCKKKGKKVRLIHKFFAVAGSITGFLLFVVPIVAILAGVVVNAYKKAKVVSSYDTQIRIEKDADFVDGFEVDGTRYIKAPFISSFNMEEAEKFCVFVLRNGDYRECYAMESETGEKVLDVLRFSGYYVAEDSYDELMDYYLNEAPIYISVDISHDGATETVVVDGLNRDFIDGITALYDQGNDFECETSQIEYSFYMKGRTEDGLYNVHAYLYVVDGELVLSEVTSGGHLRGHLVPREYSECLLEVIE